MNEPQRVEERPGRELAHVQRTGARSVLYALSAQGITFVLSIVTGLLVPFILGAGSQYANWQTYLLYTGYVMIFAFGFNDGLYLRYGHLDYKELPFSRIRGALRVLVVNLVLLTAMLVALAQLLADDGKRLAFTATALNVLVLGLNGTLVSVLQFTNQIKASSALAVVNKVMFVSAVGAMIVSEYLSFPLLVAADLWVKLVVLGANMFKSRGLFFGPSEGLRAGLIEYSRNTRVGVFLLFANLASVALVGVGLIVVERFLPARDFAVYAFAANLTSYMLVFVTASSYAVYPFLKRVPSERLAPYYGQLNALLVGGLGCLLLCYWAVRLMLTYWYPEYSGALAYLGVLFVLVIPQGKMMFLNNSYYQALRCERQLLFANLSGVAVAALLVGVGFWLTRSTLVVALGTVLAATWRCYASEFYLKRRLGISRHGNVLVELALMLAFVATSSYFSAGVGLGVFVGLVGGYTFMHRSLLVALAGKLMMARSGSERVA